MKKEANSLAECPAEKNHHSQVVGSKERIRRTRTGPNGKRAMVSDDAVESIAKEMEKRTELAIQKIGRSIGF